MPILNLYLLGAAPPTPALPSQNMLQYVQDGGLISYVLIGLSLVGLALIVRNILALRPSRIAPAFVYDQLERFARTGDTAGALEFCEKPENRCLLSSVVAGGLERSNASALGMFEMRQGMEDAGRHEVDELHRMNDGVGIIAAVGPMLGLLGTVIGMIGAFGTIGSLQGAARSSELARFMSMALVNTAEGLVVAIPATVAYALFRRWIDKLAGRTALDSEHLARLFLAAGETQPPAMPRSAPAPRARPATPPAPPTSQVAAS